MNETEPRINLPDDSYYSDEEFYKRENDFEESDSRTCPDCWHVEGYCICDEEAAELKENISETSVKQEVGEYLDLLNISFPSAAFICFGVGNLTFEDLTPEQQIDIKNHLKSIYEMRMEL